MRHASLCLLSLVLLGACSGKGQLVLGLATDLPARNELDHVSLTVTRRGETTPTVEKGWDLTDVPAGTFRLPGSFTLYADGGEPTFDVVVKGTLLGAQQVERRASLGILAGDDLFMRIGLVASCKEIGCPGSLTCIEGQCKPPFVDLRTLPAYRSQLIDHIDCQSGTTFIDSSTHVALPASTSCGDTSVCSEGTCLADPATLPHRRDDDLVPFVGGPAELFHEVGQSGSFTGVEALDAARYRACSAKLPDGNVIVLGGMDSPALDGSAAPVPGAVIYDVALARFRRIAAPPAIGPCSATVLNDDGHVLFVGEQDSGAVAFLYDPRAATDPYLPLSSPGLARYYHTATLLPDGSVLIVGGAQNVGPTFSVTPGALIFDRSLGSFRETTGAPTVDRVFHTATLAPDGKSVIIAGGIDKGGVVLASVETFDPGHGNFSVALPAMQRARALHTATALANGRLLIVGGESEPGAAASPDAELYVPNMGQSGQLVPTPLGRVGQVAVPLAGDRVLFLGGAAAFATYSVPAGGALLYDGASAAFTTLPEPKIQRFAPFAAVLLDGDVLVGGGTGTSGQSSGADGVTGPPDAGASTIDAGMAYCDPVGMPANAMCPTGMRRCTISGESDYGPMLVSDAVPRCVDEVSVVGYGMTCTPGLRQGAFDNCASGLVCVNNAATNQPTCQAVCRFDGDCIQGTGMPSRCGQIAVGPSIDGFGVCMYPCNVFAVGDCMAVGGGMCRFVRHQAVAGAQVASDGVCMQPGALPHDSVCNQTATSMMTEDCSLNEKCIAGLCRYACAAQLDCDQNFGGTCTGLAPASPTTNGYCE